MNRNVAKEIGKFIVGSSVGFTVARVLSANAPVDKRRHKAEVYVGSVAVGMMTADAADAWVERKIDAIADGYIKLKTEFIG